MRVNVYTEELTNRVELVFKTKGGKPLTGVRVYLEMPVIDEVTKLKARGPYLGDDGSDCTPAVTFWTDGDPVALFRGLATQVETELKKLASTQRLNAEAQSLRTREEK